MMEVEKGGGATLDDVGRAGGFWGGVLYATVTLQGPETRCDGWHVFKAPKTTKTAKTAETAETSKTPSSRGVV